MYNEKMRAPGLSEVERQIRDGSRQVIGWGLSEFCPIYIRQAPYTFRAILDRNSQDFPESVGGIPILPDRQLGRFDPEKTAIVLFADPCFEFEIRTFAGGFGEFPFLSPYVPARDEPRLGTQEYVSARQGWNREFLRWLNGAAQPFDRVHGPRSAVLIVPKLAYGGAERQIVNLASGLRNRGWDVLLLTFSPDDPQCRPWVDLLEFHGVQRKVIPSARTAWCDLFDNKSRHVHLAHQAAKFFNGSIAWQIAATTQVLRQNRPAVVVSYLDHANVVAGVAGVISGVADVLLSVRSESPEKYPDETPLPVERGRFESVYRTLLGFPSVRLMANCRASAHSYESWLRIRQGSVPVVHNGISDLGVSNGSRRDIRKQLGIPNNVPILLGIMRLSSEKDPLAWLAVVERVMATFPDVRAILVGDGPLSKELSTRVDSLGLNDRVHLMGYDGDIVSYLREATLLLLTSRIEGFPNVVLEAQMYERPVVATNVGGCREVLAEGLQRYIRESGDIDGLSEACLDMLRHPRHVEALGESARKFVLEKFSMDRLVTNTLALTSRP